MSRHNLRKTNQGIMFGVMGMAVVVLLVVLLFWYLCVEQTSPKEKDGEATQTEQYDE